ncbi:MAG TPA: 50S ribosomal protein L1 [Candidatus Saccharimonadales bacterium]|nr:50S ribosomal protein L1 [Candidatus Saccharimonadales bacterium]
MAEAKKVANAKVAKKVKEEIKDGIDQESSQPETKTAEKPVQREVTKAKAGKRSHKALVETEVKQAKEERKTASKTDESPAKPKVSVKSARSRLERRSKAYKKVSTLIEKGKVYSLAEAIELALKTSPVKFDASVELHVRLGVDPKQADQNIRQTVVLPAGTGKTVRVAVFAEPDDVAKAKKAGADIAGSDEFLGQLEKATINFDILIATPTNMSKLGKFARLLGPQGLMPNPKSGTVTTNIEKAVTEAKAGRIEYRIDSTGIIHVACGKVSFGKDKLIQNCQAILSSIKSAKPSSIKGNYVTSLYVTTTMGPSILVSPAEV